MRAEEKNRVAEAELEYLRTQLSEKGLTTELLYESLVQMTGECNTAISASLPFYTFTQFLLESRDNLTEEQIEILQALYATAPELGAALRRIRSLTSALRQAVTCASDTPATGPSVT